MSENLTMKKEVNINAPVSKVWEALTDPSLIKKYFFGTETITDWKKGSPILYKGEWEGKPYEDKGHILDIEKERFIKYNYWSSFSGVEDKPENYANISYELRKENGSTKMIVMQDGIKTKEQLTQSENNWAMVLEGLKKVAED